MGADRRDWKHRAWHRLLHLSAIFFIDLRRLDLAPRRAPQSPPWHGCLDAVIVAADPSLVGHLQSPSRCARVLVLDQVRARARLPSREIHRVRRLAASENFERERDREGLPMAHADLQGDLCFFSLRGKRFRETKISLPAGPAVPDVSATRFNMHRKVIRRA